jgi:hypothetical protein
MLHGERTSIGWAWYFGPFMVRRIKQRPVFIDDRDIDEFVRCLSETRDLPFSKE